MPMVWNDAANAKVFGAVLATGELTFDLDQVAGYMGCTPRALKEQLARMKKNSNINGGTAQGTVKKTPQSTGKRKRTTNVEVHQDEDEELTPSKPAKRSKLPAKAAAADEDNVDHMKRENGGDTNGDDVEVI